VLKKIIGWAEKNRVGRETGTTGIFLDLGIALTIKPRSHNDMITCEHAMIGKKLCWCPHYNENDIIIGV
jgi:hypothetical protein